MPRTLPPYRPGLGGNPVGGPVAVAYKNFASSIFYQSVAGDVIPGSAAGFGLAIAVHVRSIRLSTDYLALTGNLTATRGFSLRTTAVAFRFVVSNGVGAIIISPTSALVAANVGKTLLIAGVYDSVAGRVRLYRAGVEIGAGTVIVGYSPPDATDRTSIGISNTSALNSLVSLGAVAWTGIPTQPDIAAWGAATKAAGSIQSMGGAGVVTTDRWQPVDNPAAGTPWVPDIGVVNLIRSGAVVPVTFTPSWE